MQYNVTAAYFSPTGGTRRLALALAQGLAAPAQPAQLDLSQPGGPAPAAFAPGDLVVFAGPVFGGRLPAAMVAALRACQGNGALAVTAAVYGNRAYEDALLELNDCLAAQGFAIAASAAMVAQHSLVPAVAAGRPDGADLAQCSQYARAILNKLQAGGTPAAPLVPGARPYKEWQPSGQTPLVSAACNNCGLCAQQCPVGAIPAAQPQTTDPAKCILCARCLAVCPQHARALPPAMAAGLAQKLGPLAGVRRPNELFL